MTPDDLKPKGAVEGPATQPGPQPALGPGTLGLVPVELTAVLGQATLPVAELLALKAGAVLPLNRGVGEPVEVYAGNRLVAWAVLEEVADKPDTLAMRLIELVRTDTE